MSVVIPARARAIGSFPVRRLLPAPFRRSVGPFVFLDHMGPVVLPPGAGMDVPPHPHIGLATVTYLFEGEVLHRDSTGAEQLIRPGDVNWMIAGRGVVHSERSPPAVREAGARVHGIQSWVALPAFEEDCAPSFQHHPAASLPRQEPPGIRLCVIAGTAYGLRAPTRTATPTLYAAAELVEGASLELDASHEERACYVVSGQLEHDGQLIDEGSLLVLDEADSPRLRASLASRLMLIGGERLPAAPYIEWNFVASTRERIDMAKADWRAGRFPLVPGDEAERVPFPE